MSMLTKEKLLDTISRMPDSFSIDELLDRLVLLQKIETGIKQSESGETYSTEEARQKLGKWLQ